MDLEGNLRTYRQRRESLKWSCGHSDKGKVAKGDTRGWETER